MLRRLFGRNVLTPQQRVEIVRKSITQYLNASAAPAERESVRFGGWRLEHSAPHALLATAGAGKSAF